MQIFQAAATFRSSAVSGRRAFPVFAILMTSQGSPSIGLESGSGLPADLFADGFVNSDDLVEFVILWLWPPAPLNWPLK